MIQGFIHCLNRELEEEIGFNIFKALESGLISNIYHIGNAVTPKFNVYRFDAHFFKIILKEKPTLVVDTGEFSSGEWIDAKAMLERYLMAHAMAVPPTVKIIKQCAKDILDNTPMDLNLRFNPETEVPYIQPINGVIQFFPLSNTFPPANRTNCYLIGDTDKYLIDPSPATELELSKFKNTLKDFAFDSIFLTHHHPDHHEFSTSIARDRFHTHEYGGKNL